MATVQTGWVLIAIESFFKLDGNHNQSFFALTIPNPCLYFNDRPRLLVVGDLFGFDHLPVSALQHHLPFQPALKPSFFYLIAWRIVTKLNAQITKDNPGYRFSGSLMYFYSSSLTGCFG
jgi:hypothetical protein